MRRSSRRATDLWRTTVFRFTTVACVVVAAGVTALLGMIYVRAAAGLDARADAILARARRELALSTPDRLPQQIDRFLQANTSRSLHVALFSTTGALVAGDIATAPPGLPADGLARDVAAAGATPELRALALTTPWGERLVIGREAAAVREVRAIVLHAVVWSGVAIAGLGLIAATLLSLQPLRRLRDLEAAGRLISGGRLDLRMPVSRRRDELDLFAGVVNAMVGEIARLVDEVRSTTDAIAHDLRTPLTRVRARLHRLAHRPDTSAEVRVAGEEAIADLDEVLERFAALLRISELESQNRRAAFGGVDLTRLVNDAVELYLPLAEEAGLSIVGAADVQTFIEGDRQLLFEALGNLVDNAIKFSPPGGEVEVSAHAVGQGATLSVRDEGPGVPEGERDAVLRRFHRGEGGAEGHGLGLSLVAAVVRLHRFQLRLEDAAPGLRVVVSCWEHAAAEPSDEVKFVSLGAGGRTPR